MWAWARRSERRRSRPGSSPSARAGLAPLGDDRGRGDRSRRPRLLGVRRLPARDREAREPPCPAARGRSRGHRAPVGVDADFRQGKRLSTSCQSLHRCDEVCPIPHERCGSCCHKVTDMLRTEWPPLRPLPPDVPSPPPRVSCSGRPARDGDRRARRLAPSAALAIGFLVGAIVGIPLAVLVVYKVYCGRGS